MFAIGLILFILCLFIGISNSRRKRDSTVSLLSGYGVVLSLSLMLTSISIFLWKALP